MISVEAIVEHLGAMVLKVSGSMDQLYVSHLRPVESVDEQTLDWIGNLRPDRQQIAESSPANVVLCDPTVSYSEAMRRSGKVLIHVENPRMALSLVSERFFVKRVQAGIHPTASVHPEAVVAPGAHIGPNCSVGRCSIGDGSVLTANVTVYDGVTIGNNVVLQAGAVIGTDGLGCDRRADGSLVKFPHLGGVTIGDEVEIGANCQIARGGLSDTVIGKGCKINGLSFIAHNCSLGENVWITGNTMLAGSVRVEANVTIYSKVIVREQRTIGKGAVIGMGAVVVTDVPAGETWLGSPAKRYLR